MRTIIIIFIALFGAAFLSQLISFGLVEYRKFSNKNEILNSIKTFKEKLPIIVNENTKLEDLVVEEKNLIFKGILSGLELDTINKEKLEKFQYLSQLFSVCLTKEIYLFLKNDFNIYYDYETPNGEDLFKNRFSKNDCEPFFDKEDNNLSKLYLNLQNEIIPMSVDSETIWTSIELEGKQFKYTFLLHNLSKNEIDIKVLEEFKPQLIKNFCISPGTELFLKRDFNFKIMYLDKNNIPVLSFSMNKKMCL